MKRSERDEWVAALRSGEYLQGTGYLNSNGKFCCLGVKCELDVIAGRHGVLRRSSEGWNNIFQYGIADQYGRVESVLPSFDSALPLPNIYQSWGLSAYQVNTLAGMNDNGYNFHDIAEWIEDNVEVED